MLLHGTVFCSVVFLGYPQLEFFSEFVAPGVPAAEHRFPRGLP